MKLWDFLTIWGTDPKIPIEVRWVILSIGCIIVVIQTLFILLERDRRLKASDKDYGKIYDSFYGFVIFIPLAILLSAIEPALVIVCAYSTSSFTIAIVIIALWTLIKIGLSDIDNDKTSLLGLVSALQRAAYYMIVIKGYHYPFQRIIDPWYARRIINKQQQVYLHEQNR